MHAHVKHPAFHCTILSATFRVYGSKPLYWTSVTIIKFQGASTSHLKDLLAPKQQIISCIQQKSVAKESPCFFLTSFSGPSPAQETLVTRGKQENEKKSMFDVFSMRWHYTTTFRCVAVILDFSQRALSLWFLDNLYFYFYFFRFLVFAQNRPQNNDDDWMFWSGEKARKITVYNLGIFLSKGLGWPKLPLWWKAK